jgi:hypothetical protein
MSYIASLCVFSASHPSLVEAHPVFHRTSTPFLDSQGLPIPSHASYASPLPAAQLPDSPWSDSTASPALTAFSPPLPFSPTSPVTSTFNSPTTPATSLLPAFASPRPAQSKPSKPNRTFVARRRKSSFRGSPHRPEGRRRSCASSNASIRSGRSLHARTASLPNLRRAASCEDHPLPSYRRPSIPIPFDTFQPRAPRTRSPGHDAWFTDPLRSATAPIVFPSKRPSKPPRPPRSSDRLRSTPATHNVVASGVCEAIAFAHPRVVVVPGSPTSSFHDEEPTPVQRKESVRRLTAKEKGKGKAVNLPWDEQSTGDEEDASSVLRVLRENEASRLERAGWSDSATRTLGYGLSTRLADRDRDRSRRDGAKSAAAVERRKIRHNVQRRKRREAAAGESEYETDRGRGRSASTGEQVPSSSPPIPTSFEPFSSLGRKLSFGKARSKSRERRRSDAGATSDGGAGLGLGLVSALRRKTSATISRGSHGSGAPPAPTTPTVRGQPIRHLQRSNSVDSLFIRANVAPGPIGRDVLYSSEVDTQYGEALTSPPDEPSPQKGESKIRSDQSQNAFLSLPPHLHHLLRSPERERFTPSRAPPPVPSLLPVAPFSTSTFLEQLDKRDSTASNARLSSQLEEKLSKQSQRNSTYSTHSIEGVLPVATTAPLVWRDRAEDEQKPGSEQDQLEHSSVSLPKSLRSTEQRSLRTGGSFASLLTVADQPFKIQSQISPVVATAKRPTMKGSRSSSSKMGKHSRKSSGSELEMRTEGDYGGLVRLALLIFIPFG